MRGQYRLFRSEIGEHFHLRKALQRSALRIGNLSGVALGGDVAPRQSGVVVRRADQSVEVHLVCVTVHYRALFSGRKVT